MADFLENVGDDPRFQSGLPAAQRADDLSFILMAGVTAADLTQFVVGKSPELANGLAAAESSPDESLAGATEAGAHIETVAEQPEPDFAERTEVPSSLGDIEPATSMEFDWAAYPREAHGLPGESSSGVEEIRGGSESLPSRTAKAEDRLTEARTRHSLTLREAEEYLALLEAQIRNRLAETEEHHEPPHEEQSALE